MAALYKTAPFEPRYDHAETFLLLLTGIALLGAVAISAQQLPSALTTDPPPDKEFPPAMAAPDVLSHGAKLNAVLCVASGRRPHPTVVWIDGFPGNEKKLALADSVRRAGWNVLIFLSARGITTCGRNVCGVTSRSGRKRRKVELLGLRRSL